MARTSATTTPPDAARFRERNLVTGGGVSAEREVGNWTTPRQ
jgi:hypothetical protein